MTVTTKLIQPILIMSGYSEFSKSNNAISAEEEGRFPASRAAKRLNIPTGFIRDCCQFARQNNEYHHVSKYYNEVAYYDAAEIQRWIDKHPDTEEEAGGPFDAALARWRCEQNKPQVVHTNVTVTWLEWGGTRSHPHASERTVAGCTVRDEGGKFVTVFLPDGRAMRKGKDTRGFEATVNGQSICGP